MTLLSCRLVSTSYFNFFHAAFCTTLRPDLLVTGPKGWVHYILKAEQLRITPSTTHDLTRLLP
jgi:hypothetical protein